MNQFKNIFLGLETRSYSAGRLRPEVHARQREAQRPGDGRPDRQASHLLRDARQLLLRRLFQEGGHRLCLGAHDRRLRLDPDRLYVTVYEEDDEAFAIWAGDIGVPAGPDLPLREKGQLLVHGRDGPVRSLLGDPLRPRRGHRAGRPVRPHRKGERPVRRALEPRLHGKEPGRKGASSTRSRRRPSTRGWAWNGWPPSSRGRRATTTPTSSCRSSRRSARSPGGSTRPATKATSRSGSSPTTSGP